MTHKFAYMPLFSSQGSYQILCQLPPGKGSHLSAFTTEIIKIENCNPGSKIIFEIHNENNEQTDVIRNVLIKCRRDYIHYVNLYINNHFIVQVIPELEEIQDQILARKKIKDGWFDLKLLNGQDIYKIRGNVELHVKLKNNFTKPINIDLLYDSKILSVDLFREYFSKSVRMWHTYPETIEKIEDFKETGLERSIPVRFHGAAKYMIWTIEPADDNTRIITKELHKTLIQIYEEHQVPPELANMINAYNRMNGKHILTDSYAMNSASLEVHGVHSATLSSEYYNEIVPYKYFNGFPQSRETYVYSFAEDPCELYKYSGGLAAHSLCLNVKIKMNMPGKFKIRFYMISNMSIIISQGNIVPHLVLHGDALLY